MKKILLIGLAVVLLVFLLVPSLTTPNENQMTEGPQESEMAENGNSTEVTDETKVDENNTTAEPNETTEPDETTIQTDGGEDADDDENTGSSIYSVYDDFFEKYTILEETIPEDVKIYGNDRGWLIGFDNRRITVTVDGTDSFLDVLNAIVIYTDKGEPVIRHKNKLYVLESDTTAREVATIWEIGSEAVELSMRNGDYVFTLTMDLVKIRVEYSDSGYYERVLWYDVLNASPVRLEVSNYDSKEVRCVRILDESTMECDTETIPAEELPEDQLYDYKNPNK